MARLYKKGKFPFLFDFANKSAEEPRNSPRMANRFILSSAGVSRTASDDSSSSVGEDLIEQFEQEFGINAGFEMPTAEEADLLLPREMPIRPILPPGEEPPLAQPAAAENIRVPGPDQRAIEEPRSRNFRLQAYKIAITYPDCSLSREQIAAGMRLIFEPKLVEMERDPNFIQGEDSEKLRAIEWMVIGQETHTRPGPRQGKLHGHVALALKKRSNIRSHSALDLPGRNPAPNDPNQNATFHPNIERMKFPVEWVRYVTKEDATPLVWRLDLAKFLEQGAGKLDRLALAAYEAKENWRYLVVNQHPGLYMLYQQKLDGMERLGKRLREAPTRQGWAVLYPREEFKGQRNVLDFIRIPLNQPRRMKQFQYYIWAPPNHGKTTFKERLLRAGFKGYELPRNNDYALWQEDYFSFAYGDEYTASYMSPTDINRFSDGSYLVMNVKGGIVEKKQNLTVILMSNVKIRDCYKIYTPPAPPPPPAAKGKQPPAASIRGFTRPNDSHNATVDGFLARFEPGYIDGTIYDLFNAELYDNEGNLIPEDREGASDEHCCRQCAKYKKLDGSDACDCVIQE